MTDDTRAFTVPCDGVHPGDDWSADALAAADLPPTLCTRPGRRAAATAHWAVGKHPLIAIAETEHTQGKQGQLMQAISACLSASMHTGDTVEVILETRDRRYPDLVLTARWPDEEAAPVDTPFIGAELPS